MYININDREDVWMCFWQCRPNVPQIRQLLIDYVYPIITNIRLWFSVWLPSTNVRHGHSLSSNVGAWGMWTCSSFFYYLNWKAAFLWIAVSYWNYQMTIESKALNLQATLNNGTPYVEYYIFNTSMSRVVLNTIYIVWFQICSLHYTNYSI